jgi:hypothetical protein
MDGTISVGRNIGIEPMDDSRWEQFVDDVLSLIHKHGGEVYTIADGGGAWDGVAEQSAVIVFGGTSHDFADELSALASAYGQEAIGLLSGESSLVYGEDYAGEGV